MEAVGQLTGGLAHDFNNLLGGIFGSLELMQSRLSKGRVHDLEKFIAAAQDAARRAAALTHRLLAFSRRQTLAPTPTDVNRLVQGMRELIQRTVGPGIRIVAADAAEGWPALVDASQLENALLNLCINARDAMPDGGCIIIETFNTRLNEQAARQQGMAKGDYLELRVADTGAGMTPDVVARAFEPFFTTKPIGQGTGLGLSMTYGFVQQSGGQIRIHSAVGQGTAVTLYLPRHHGPVAVEKQALATNQAVRAQQGETVLVVDDEPTVHLLLREALQALGYHVLEATHSAAGLDLLHSQARIDVLVTDIGLPGGMNGYQLAEAALLRRPALKVLFITGYDESVVHRSSALTRSMEVVVKPFSLDEMIARIGRMVAGGTCA